MSSDGMRGGRDSEGPGDIMREINVSIEVDQRLYRQDIKASKAHAAMLGKQNIVTADDADKIVKGLDIVLSKIETGLITFDAKLEAVRKLEDIHQNVEDLLTKEIGQPGGRLHTARSRNDQVATDFKLWIRDEIDEIDLALATYQVALAARALEHAATLMPGFTHLQVAQPITLGHHLLAYVEMAARDRGRFADARRRLNENPLGSAALAGTSFHLDRTMTAEALEFDRPTANSLDAVSDRDFAIETLAAASIAAMHLSRFAEEIVIWFSQLIGFINLSPALTTHSSIMPQKRNPDAAELVRAKTGRIFGALQALLVVMKGLPLAYQKDMQEDKETTMGAVAALRLCIRAMTEMVIDMKPDVERMKQAAGQGYSTATDLADWIVKELRLPFRLAHKITGRIVTAAEERGIPSLEELPLAIMREEEKKVLQEENLPEQEPRITEAVFEVLSVEQSVASRTSVGGTAPVNVKREATKWLEKLAKK